MPFEKLIELELENDFTSDIIQEKLQSSNNLVNAIRLHRISDISLLLSSINTNPEQFINVENLYLEYCSIPNDQLNSLVAQLKKLQTLAVESYNSTLSLKADEDFYTEIFILFKQYPNLKRLRLCISMSETEIWFLVFSHLVPNAPKNLEVLNIETTLNEGDDSTELRYYPQDLRKNASTDLSGQEYENFSTQHYNSLLNILFTGLLQNRWLKSLSIDCPYFKISYSDVILPLFFLVMKKYENIELYFNVNDKILEILASAIKHNKTLKSLSISNFWGEIKDVDKCIEKLTDSFPENLTSFTFTPGKYLKESTVKNLVEILQKKSNLQQIILCDLIAPEHIKLFAPLINKNSQLERLSTLPNKLKDNIIKNIIENLESFLKTLEITYTVVDIFDFYLNHGENSEIKQQVLHFKKVIAAKNVLTKPLSANEQTNMQPNSKHSLFNLTAFFIRKNPEARIHFLEKISNIPDTVIDRVLAAQTLLDQEISKEKDDNVISLEGSESAAKYQRNH